MIRFYDKKYRYFAYFDPLTGQGARSNAYDEFGRDTGEDPYRASFPELLDIGIMGHCEHGKSGLCLQSGVECYQNGLGIEEPNMSLDQFKRLIDECKGRTFQVALGGRGDPDQHENFVEILKYAHENGVVPNFTTSGYGLKSELIPYIKAYCGAVAVSWYRNDYTHKALRMLINAGVKTNIHFVLSKASIDEAIMMIEENRIPEGVNRVIFLLHKPVGLGSFTNVLDVKDKRVNRFFSQIDLPEVADRLGFDSCCVPAILNFAKNIHPMCIEACEACRFSAYVSPDFKLIPCSFEKDSKYAVSLTNSSIEEAWNSKPFDSFRNLQEGKCIDCPTRTSCYAGCPIVPKITLCPTVDPHHAREVAP